VNNEKVIILYFSEVNKIENFKKVKWS